MKPFNEPFEYEGNAYGVPFAIRFALDQTETVWLAECYMGFPLGHSLYARANPNGYGWMVPIGTRLFYAEYSEDRTHKWIGFAFAAENDMGLAMEATEKLIAQLCPVMDITAGGATVGPAYVKVY